MLLITHDFAEIIAPIMYTGINLNIPVQSPFHSCCFCQFDEVVLEKPRNDEHAF